MYKIVTEDAFLWEDVNLNEKTVLEGGTSWGNTTSFIAEKVNVNKWRTKLISVDIDDSHFNDIQRRLAGYFEDFLLRKGDLSNLHFIPSESIDFVICNYTLSSVNQFPLRAVKAVQEFFRVLKPDGTLIITEEMPIWAVDNRDYEYWSKRLRIIKSISVLKAMAHFNEMHPQDLEEALKLVGFKNLKRHEFNEKINSELATRFLDKRKQTLIKGLNDLENEHLTKGYVELTEKLLKEFENMKEFFAPAYIVKAIK